MRKNQTRGRGDAETRRGFTATERPARLRRAGRATGRRGEEAKNRSEPGRVHGLAQQKLVLASASPRRVEVLRRAGIAFQVRPARLDERARLGETPESYVRRLAREKAEKVWQPGDRVLGADTVVVIGKRILGKPRGNREAARMLRQLSGKMHRVLTGICLLDGVRPRRAVVETRVWFRPLRRAEITAYVASGEPLDKAGAYAIQGLASKFVRRIEGCYFNVMGLPVSRIYGWLAASANWRSISPGK